MELSEDEGESDFSEGDSDYEEAPTSFVNSALAKRYGWYI